ncbi:MAG TPA: EamA family transporter RarD [Accumulibacter sp.]|uniref:EamA family transporter RarD n=2 Tax=Accumulibacter sp. TaxID=2053492 RepID=UPI00287B56E0|nr:EamA family transporter RarD [Accumulibacter sp.]MDS4054120.1 EamA family transporter RarD [Accumulibacter sp.]HMV05091.1 EamA family transporter RarD [Accumulibacter sp.]HMW63293.1 EamA family transporter RarD [Accumulibacter sp.]HMW79809.1 EamA family transporter RarD [Accumulibacter sp.]HMX68308.1 EamA family transporter RarD [Accumulibacter sp.]
MSGNPQVAGVGFGLLAYGMWGFFPLFFRQLSHVPPLDILSNRAVWACAFVAVLLTLRRDWRKVLTVFGTRRQVLMLAVAALLIGSNWLVFLWAVANQQVIASSLGYFLTPLVNVVLGLLVLRERLTRLKWISVALALAAIANEIVWLGRLPWVSLVLAGTFGTYGLVRKQLPVDVVSGLWLETLAMLPFCVLYALWQAEHAHFVFTGHDLTTMCLLVGAGALTALPLLSFSAAAQRLDLVTLGMLMYINPTLQFVIAIWVFGEALQAARLLSFGLIWCGLLVFSWSAWREYRAAGRSAKGDDQPLNERA